MRKIALVLIMLSTLVACDQKGSNRVDSTFYNDADFSVHCLYGHKYLVRIVGARTYMAPKFDPQTSLPEKCE